MRITKETVSTIAQSYRYPLIHIYFEQERVINRLQTAHASYPELSLEELVKQEYQKITDFAEYKLIQLGYCTAEISGLTLAQKEALQVLRCEPSELSGLNETQVKAMALGVPRGVVIQSWFDKQCLEAVEHKLPYELGACLSIDFTGPVIELMDEFLARLAVRMDGYPDELQKTILEKWNDNNDISGKDLRLYLSTLASKNRNLHVAKVCSAIRAFHKPQFTERGLKSFTRKILSLPMLEAAGAAALGLNEKLRALQDLTQREDLVLKEKFTLLLEGFDAYQALAGKLNVASPSSLRCSVGRPSIFPVPVSPSLLAALNEDAFSLGPAAIYAGGTPR